MKNLTKQELIENIKETMMERETYYINDVDSNINTDDLIEFKSIEPTRVSLDSLEKETLIDILDETLTLDSSILNKTVNSLFIENKKAFDGTSFFSKSRPNLEGLDTINNIWLGNGITLAQVEQDLSGARARLRGFKDKNDKLFNNINKYTKMIVFVPKQLEDIFLELKDDKYLRGTDFSNIHKDTFELVINKNQSTNNNDWYILNNASDFNTVIYSTTDSEIKFGLGNPTAIVKIENK